MRSGKRKKTHASVFDRFRARRRDGRTRSRKPKNAFKTDPSLVGVRLGSVSRLRQLITIGELSTELCLSCVRDITADARRTREKPRLKAFALRGRARTPQVNEIQSSVVKFPFQESLQMVRTMISSSSAFARMVHETETETLRLARSASRSVRFELRRLGTGPSALRAVHRKSSCGRIRALRATWRESVARVTL